jgi:hypothetical protein
MARLILALTCVLSLAQEPIRVTTNLVQVPVGVRDKKGWSAEQLKAADFELLDNGVRQTLVQCNLNTSPRETVIVFDQSESMQPELPALYEAVREFVTASPGDKISVISVRSSANLDIAPTDDQDRLLRGLGAVVAGGRTALFDGVHLALSRLRAERTPHSAVIVLSDGGDNSSRARPTDLRISPPKPALKIHTIATTVPFPRSNEAEGLAALKGLAARREVGIGSQRLLTSQTHPQAPKRSSVCLGYSPSVPLDGRAHQDPGEGEAKGLQLTWRKSYAAD